MHILLWIILIALAALVIFAASRPNVFRVQRSTTIKAEPEIVYGLLDDFKNWRQWSPWEGLDADLKRDYSGADYGVGAVYAWEGKKAGAGRMEIVESTPAKRVLINLDFLKPFKASNKAEFTLTPTDDGTHLNWAMYGPQPFMFKLMGLFMNADKMVGKDFEKGLASLKQIAENEAN